MGKQQLPRRVLALLFAIVFADLVGFGIVIPLLPLYAERYHPHPAIFGLLMASYSLMQFVFSPLLGRLSDRFGRRPVLLLSLWGSSTGYLLFALADSLPALFAARIVAGAAGANIATAQAVIADVTTQSERTRGMGLIGAAFGLGFVAGPALAGLLLHWGSRAPGFAASAFSLLACGFAWAFLPETRPQGHPARRQRCFFFLPAAFGRWPSLRPLLAITFLMIAGWAAVEVTLAQFLHARFAMKQQGVAWLFAYLGFSAVLVQGLLVGKARAFWDDKTLLLLGLTLGLGGLLALAGNTSFPALFFIFPVLAAGQGLANPSLSSLVSRSAPLDAQGEALGAYQGVGSAARIVGPFLGQLAWGHWGQVAPALSAAALLLVAIFLAALVLARAQ